MYVARVVRNAVKYTLIPIGGLAGLTGLLLGIAASNNQNHEENFVGGKLTRKADVLFLGKPVSSTTLVSYNDGTVQMDRSPSHLSSLPCSASWVQYTGHKRDGLVETIDTFPAFWDDITVAFGGYSCDTQFTRSRDHDAHPALFSEADKDFKEQFKRFGIDN